MMAKFRLFLAALGYLLSVVRPIRDFIKGSEDAKSEAVRRRLDYTAKEMKSKYLSVSSFDDDEEIE
jgi:hypothetical protein